MSTTFLLQNGCAGWLVKSDIYWNAMGDIMLARSFRQSLREFVQARELTKALGADRRAATSMLPAALCTINARLDHARSQLFTKTEREAASAAIRSAPLSPTDLARLHYGEGLARDEYMRNVEPMWATVGINDTYVADLRAAIAGTLSNDQLEELLGDFLRQYRLRGNINAVSGSPEWRQIARSIAEAELEVLAQMYERDEGVPAYQLTHPAHLAPEIVEVEVAPFVEPLSLQQLLEQHLQRLEDQGGGVSARKGWTPVFNDLFQFLKETRELKGSSIQQSDDARRLTAEEVIAWRDLKLETLSAKTVRDVWLASLKAVLSDAVADRKLPENVAKGVRVHVYAKPISREKGFTDSEALTILKFCLAYQPPARDNPANRESPHTTAARRWGPWLCAFTGARVGEILQLRRSDIRTEDGICYLHITPEAGNVKGKHYRNVPIHQQLKDIGFLEFVEAQPEGPLFHSPTGSPDKRPAQAVSASVGKWLQAKGLSPAGVQPSHGWRHRFKTLSREAGLDPYIVDSIQGHAGRTASDGYGDATLRAKNLAIEKLAFYSISS
ncbi:site-specific integrase [Devosia algicola]|uniref:Site-specific integrase n=1 Tax=Devosia algicola TaxID=3026418 RepID=A0ABY7YMD0_9HYPH|nr:site-specific integrase [Devosia algicola]WDR02367.1 site-specific integrase [Devosia algicola]